jgi:formate C-acetyltransferase
MARWYNWVIGRVTPDGKDASNPLSYLILEAARDCPSPHHTITLRVHDGTPEALMSKALREERVSGLHISHFVKSKDLTPYCFF